MNTTRHLRKALRSVAITATATAALLVGATSGPASAASLDPSSIATCAFTPSTVTINPKDAPTAVALTYTGGVNAVAKIFINDVLAFADDVDVTGYPGSESWVSDFAGTKVDTALYSFDTDENQVEQCRLTVTYGAKLAVTVTASSPAAITAGTPLPAITFTTSVALDPEVDWTNAPTCAVYADSTSTTPLTGSVPAGTYVTRCSGGTSPFYNPTYVNGTITVLSNAVNYGHSDKSAAPQDRSRLAFTPTPPSGPKPKK